METINKKHVTLIYNEKELSTMAKEFCADALSIIKEREYQISDESKESLERMIKLDWTPLFANMSKNRKKKFNRYVNRYYKNKSLYTMNTLFHFIYNSVLILGEVDEHKEVKSKWWTLITRTPKGFKKVKIESSAKHQAIQEKRKKWKEAQAIADTLLAEYKTEKGDYYKTKN